MLYSRPPSAPAGLMPFTAAHALAALLLLPVVANAQTLSPLAAMPAELTYFTQRTESGTVVELVNDSLRVGRLRRDAGGVWFEETARVYMPVPPAHSDAAGERLFLLLTDGRFIVYDFADPAQPGLLVELDSVPFDFFQVEGDLLYGRQPGARIALFDISELGVFGHYSTIDAFGATITFAVRGNALYTLSDPTGIDSRVSVYNVSTPYWPTEQDRIDSNAGRATTLALSGSSLLVSSPSFVASVDVKDPLTFAGRDTVRVHAEHYLAGTQPPALVSGGDGRAYALSTRGRWLYALDVSSVGLSLADSLDVGWGGYTERRHVLWHPEIDAVSATTRGRGTALADAVSLDLLGTVWNGGAGYTEVVPYGDHARAWSLEGGVRTLSWALPPVLSTEAAWSLPWNATSLAVRGDTAYVSLGNTELAILDVSDPLAPVYLGGVHGVPTYALALLGRHLVSRTQGAISVIDVSDAGTPAETASHPAPSGRIFMAGALDPVTRRYYATTRDQLLALDLSGDGQISLAGEADMPDRPRHVAVAPEAQALYVATDDSLYRVNVSDPSTMEWQSVATLAETVNGIGIVEATAGAVSVYVATPTQVYEFTGDGEVAGSLPVRASGVRATPFHDYATVWGSDGVYVLSPGRTVAASPSPAGSALGLVASPNPTRGAASLSLALPEAADVKVAVYDALGRRVATLSEPMAAGAGRVALDVSGWAPGVYTVRVRASDAVATTRLTVVR